MKKTSLVILVLFFPFFLYSQGLEDIIVETIPVTAAAHAADPSLPANATAYRVFVDMLPDYEMQAVFGKSTNILVFETTTSFYNNADGVTAGRQLPNFLFNDLAGRFDSYITVDAVTTSRVGILISEDTDGTADGYTTGTSLPLQTIGADFEVPFGSASYSGKFTVTNGAYNVNGGEQGLTATNRVLIGQFTTDGVFSFELNIQIRPAGGSGDAVRYVAKNPTGLDCVFPKLSYSSDRGTAPTVNIVSPSNGSAFKTNESVSITASSEDADGTVSLVEFLVDGIKVSEDAWVPYTFNWIATSGTHELTARATDNSGKQTTSAVVTIFVNAPPSVDLTAPIDGSKVPSGNIVNLEAVAGDPDGSVARVEFYINGNKVGEDLTTPYQFNWKSTAGKADITAVVTDNKGAKETSSAVSIEVIHPYELGFIQQPCHQDIICVPLHVMDPLSDVIGFDVVMKFNPVKVMPNGIITLYSDLINPVYADYAANINQANGTLNIAVFLKSSAPKGTCFSGTGKLFCIEYAKTEAFMPVDTVAFTVTSLIERYYTGVVTKEVKPGNCITYEEYAFTGALKFWNDNSPIAYNSNNPGQYLITDISGSDPSDCSLKSGVIVHPNDSGVFKHDIRNGSAITISRDILPTSEVQAVVNGMDALLTMKVVLKDTSFIPSACQMIAMDVNMDGVVSSGDVSQINQRSMLMIKEFKQVWNYNKQRIEILDKPSKDWLFVNAKSIANDSHFKISSKYPESDDAGFSKLDVPETSECHILSVSDFKSCPINEPETIMGIMLGDVNGNYSSIPADGRLKTTNAESDLVVFDISNAQLSENKVQIPVYISSEYSVKALDFQFRFNDEKLAFDTIFNLTGYIEPTYHFNEEDSTLRFTSYSFLNYQTNQNLVLIRFDLLNAALSRTDFHHVKTWLNGDSVGYRITEYSPSSLQENYFTPEIRVYPNPARNLIHVDISEESTLEIMDLNGSILSESTPLRANQKQEINVEQLNDGMYILKFQTGGYTLIRKLVVNKYR